MSATIQKALTSAAVLSISYLATIHATYYSSRDLAPSSAVAAATQASPLSWYADAGVAAHRSLAAGAAFSVRWRGLVRPPDSWAVDDWMRGEGWQ